jgi:hypothetical protein
MKIKLLHKIKQIVTGEFITKEGELVETKKITWCLIPLW